MEHDLRYDRADEFMEVVLATGTRGTTMRWWWTRARAVRPSRTRCSRLDHQGRFFRSRGPFTVPRSAQGHPVLIQAGSSGRGKRFAARWAETVFVAYPRHRRGKRDYAEMKEAIAEQGRDPELVTLNTIAYPVVAPRRRRPKTRWR